MRSAGKFLLIVGIAMWGLLVLGSLFVLGAKEDYNKKYGKFWDAIGAELTGEAQQDRELIDMLVWCNRALLGGGTLSVIGGVAALMAGKKATKPAEG